MASNAAWSWTVIVAVPMTLILSRVVVHARTPIVAQATPLTAALPYRVGAWQQVTTDVAVVDPTDRGEGRGFNDVYDSVENRVYRRADNSDQIMVTLAYRRVQSSESKIHRPELCYYAQGFSIDDKSRVAIRDGATTIPAQAFRARGQSRTETVVFWIRIGDEMPVSSWVTRWLLLRDGLKGRSPDGILVRASIIRKGASADTQEQKLAELSAFLSTLAASAPPAGRKLLLGPARGGGDQTAL